MNVGGKSSASLMSWLSHDSVPITISACVDWTMFCSWAGLPGVLIDWQLRIKTLNGRSDLEGDTFDGEEEAIGLEKLFQMILSGECHSNM